MKKLFERFRRAFSKESMLLEDGTLDFKQLTFKAVLLLALLLAIGFAVVHLVDFQAADPDTLVKRVIDMFGVKGVAIFVFFVDAFIVPMTPDLMWPFVLDWNPLSVILVMGCSSAAGGFVAYCWGHLIGLIPPIKRWLVAHIHGDLPKILEKYGIWGIVIAGLTPIPFSTVCVLGGIVRLKPEQVFLGCLSRIARMGIYYLFVAGIIG